MHSEPTAPPTLTPLRLTPKAIEKVREAMRQEEPAGSALRIGVTGGGCSGYHYDLGFAEQARPDDTQLEIEGLRILVDASSLPRLQGAVLDYVVGLHGAGFKFFNSHADHACGCGAPATE